MNKERPHVLVLPEDDANRQLANGFQLDHSLDTRRMQVLKEAGGWHEVVRCFKVEHIAEMDRYANRFLFLIVDFDQRENRLDDIKAEVPDRLKERVFVLGSWSEPEELRRTIGSSYESIGLALAKECRDGVESTWAHDLLRHNAGELERLRQRIHPILFSGI